MKVLKIKNLKTNFYTESGIVKAVNNISFSLNRDETLGIVGESGCGKSTTALSILRLIKPPIGKIETGEIFVDGKDILKLPRGEMRKIRGSIISMIFQNPMTSLNPVFSIGNQLIEALMIHQRISKKKAKKVAIDLLGMTKIQDPEKRINEYPFELSGGMRQRVMIAMALACKPKVLIADEPTTALDVTIQAQILYLMNELKETNNTAVIYITHDLGVIAEMADRVIVMYAGKIVESGSLYDVFYNTHHPYTEGLLKSIPKITSSIEKKLYQIDGNPPQLLNLPTGCSFRTRCKYSKEICLKSTPELKTIDGNHKSSCFL